MCKHVLEVSIMKKYFILTVAVMAVVAMTLGVYAQPQGGAGAGAGRMRGGFGNQEAQQNAVAAIEAQLAKLKAGMTAQPARPENFQDMSEEERTKFRDAMMKQREEQAAILAAIDDQIMILKGRQVQTEHEAAMEELQAIQVMAASENAPKTAKYVEEMIAKKNQAFQEKAEKLGIRLGRGRGQGGQGGPGGQNQGQGGQGRGQRGGTQGGGQ
jgi:hypothetical protein